MLLCLRCRSETFAWNLYRAAAGRCRCFLFLDCLSCLVPGTEMGRAELGPYFCSGYLWYACSFRTGHSRSSICPEGAYHSSSRHFPGVCLDDLGVGIWPGSLRLTARKPMLNPPAYSPPSGSIIEQSGSRAVASLGFALVPKASLPYFRWLHNKR